GGQPHGPQHRHVLRRGLPARHRGYPHHRLRACGYLLPRPYRPGPFGRYESSSAGPRVRDHATPASTAAGPGGSGKGTLAGRLAARLGWHLLDSGALYRLLALAAQKRGKGLADEQALVELAANLDVQFIADAEGGEQRIMLEGDDVSRTIRTETVGAGASRVAALPAVRQALLARQQAFRETPGLVADGRDMGTVVF